MLKTHSPGPSHRSWVLYLVFGLLCFVAAVPVALSARSFLTTAQHAQGLVVALPYGPGKPEIQFSTPAGETFTFTEHDFGNYQLGQKVRVLFDPASPTGTAEVDSPATTSVRNPRSTKSRMIEAETHFDVDADSYTLVAVELPPE